MASSRRQPTPVGQDDRRPGQYDAALVVSVAALIVAIAQFAQSIYATRSQQTPQPTAQAIARDTRIELRQREITLSEQTLRAPGGEVTRKQGSQAPSGTSSEEHPVESRARLWSSCATEPR
jgi:hypothetical protein